jgi:hypothetical protein
VFGDTLGGRNRVNLGMDSKIIRGPLLAALMVR